MRTRNIIAANLVLASSFLLQPVSLRAQSFAPESLAGSLLTVAVSSGHAPFATSGTYRFFISAAGTNYTVLGRAGPLNSGLCNYSKASPTAGTATLVDAASGPGISLTLAFASPTNGTLALTNANGFQTGAFTLADYAATTPPQLFLPGLAAGQFQSYLGGQPGFVYAVETSSNLVKWQPWLMVPLADLSTNFSDATGQKASFYRARLNATAFAPADVTNQTFNLTINDGKSPLATNGICQWQADTNDLRYQIIGGPGMTSSSGNYTYTRTGPDSGLISCQDSAAGTLNEQLVFTAPQSGYFFTTNSAGFEAGTFILAAGAVEFLGNVKFTADASRAGTLVFAADGQPASLSVTSANGWGWTLDFPGDALTEPQSITMMPFATVDSSQALLPIVSGVMLEPEGVQFDDGVTLTVTPPGPVGANAALMMAGGDGGNLYFVGGTNETGALSVILFHFSSAGATDPSGAQWSAFYAAELARAQQAYAQATNDVKSLLNNATNQPPPPPDYVWDCSGATNTDAQAKIDKYIQSLFARENNAISRLVSAAWELKSLGQDYTTNATKLAKTLIQTDEFAQVTTLFARYYTSDPSNTNLTVFVDANSYKFMALYRLSSGVNQQDQSFGGKGNTNWLALTKNWSKAILNGSLRQVKDSHLYSLAPVMLSVLAFRSTVLHITTDTTAGFQTKLAKALTFELTLNLTFAFSDWDSDGPQDDQVNETAQGDVANLLAGLTPPFTVVTNAIKLVSGSWASYMDDCSYVLDSGQSSTWHIALGLQTCGQAPKVILVLNGPWLTFETWTGCDEVSTPDPWLGVIWGTAFVCLPAGVNGSGGLFQFPLQDGQAEVVNETVQGDSSAGLCADPLQQATGTLQIQIQHTPQ
jgi:hypothetical protein